MPTETPNSTRARQTIVVRPEEGQIFHAFGDTVQVKLSGDETNGSIVLGLGKTPPGHGPPPPIHHHEDELFIALEGSLRFLAEDGWCGQSDPAG